MIGDQKRKLKLLAFCKGIVGLIDDQKRSAFHKGIARLIGGQKEC